MAVTRESVISKLIGAWELVSFASHSQTSSDTLYPLGSDAKGIIMYTPDGYMSAQLQSPGQKHFAVPHPRDGSESELAESARRYLAYSGPFSLDMSGKNPVVVHHFTVSTFPNWLGDDQRRIINFEGDELVLTTEYAIEVEGKKWDPIVRWRRASVNNPSKQ